MAINKHDILKQNNGFGEILYISQTEKKRLNYIIPVLEFLFTDKEINIVELEKKLKFSRDNIKKTISLLIEKKFIQEKGEKQHNRKIYELYSELELSEYLQNLKNWKQFNHF